MASKVRARILRAAEEEFSRCGFNGSSTRAIAKIADVHETSLFRIFDSKEALFRTIFDCVLERMAHAPIVLGPGWKQSIIAFAKALRSTWSPETARQFLSAGASATVTQAQLGHTDPRITLGIYAHVVGDEQRTAAERVAGILLSDVVGLRGNSQTVN